MTIAFYEPLINTLEMLIPGFEHRLDGVDAEGGARDRDDGRGDDIAHVSAAVIRSATLEIGALASHETSGRRGSALIRMVCEAEALLLRTAIAHQRTSHRRH